MDRHIKQNLTGQSHSEWDMPSKPFLTIGEVANLLQVSNRTVYNLIYKGTLRACKITYHITLITKEDFFLMIKETTGKGKRGVPASHWCDNPVRHGEIQVNLLQRWSRRHQERDAELWGNHRAAESGRRMALRLCGTPPALWGNQTSPHTQWGWRCCGRSVWLEDWERARVCVMNQFS